MSTPIFQKNSSFFGWLPIQNMLLYKYGSGARRLIYAPGAYTPLYLVEKKMGPNHLFWLTSTPKDRIIIIQPEQETALTKKRVRLSQTSRRKTSLLKGWAELWPETQSPKSLKSLTFFGRHLQAPERPPRGPSSNPLIRRHKSLESLDFSAIIIRYEIQKPQV